MTVGWEKSDWVMLVILLRKTCHVDDFSRERRAKGSCCEHPPGVWGEGSGAEMRLWAGIYFLVRLLTIHPASADKSEGGRGLQNTSFSIISSSTAVGAVFLKSGAFERISRDSIL